MRTGIMKLALIKATNKKLDQLILGAKRNHVTSAIKVNRGEICVAKQLQATNKLDRTYTKSDAKCNRATSADKGRVTNRREICSL